MIGMFVVLVAVLFPFGLMVASKMFKTMMADRMVQDVDALAESRSQHPPKRNQWHIDYPEYAAVAGDVAER